MTARRTASPAAKTVRLLHAALVTGVVLFGLVCHFLLRRTLTDAPAFPPSLVNVFLGLCVLAFVASLLLRRRVPRRSTDQSVDLFWTKALAPAMLTWMPLDLASLAAVFVYASTGLPQAIAIWAVGVLFLLMLRPAYYERR